MSYSFQIEPAATKELALKAVEAQFDEVVKQQRHHEHDRAAALANVVAHLALIGEPQEGEKVCVHAHGSLGWSYEGDKQDIERYNVASSGCSVSVYRTP